MQFNHSDYPYTKISEEFGLKPEFFYAYNNLDAEEIEIDDKVDNDYSNIYINISDKYNKIERFSGAISSLYLEIWWSSVLITT